MPTVIEKDSPALFGGHPDARPRVSPPLEDSGSLGAYQSLDLTPVIGREYHGLQVAEILQSAKRDQLIQDLAVTSTLHLSLPVMLSADSYSLFPWRGVPS